MILLTVEAESALQEKYPEDYEARDDDKFNYRYRGMSRSRTAERIAYSWLRRRRVLPGCHRTAGTRHHGIGKTGQYPDRLPSGRHNLSGFRSPAILI